VLPTAKYQGGPTPVGVVSGSDGDLWDVSAEYGEAPQGLFAGGVVLNLTP
jgi:hypothetical protein